MTTLLASLLAAQALPQGTPVIASGAALTVPVGGLERTGARAETVDAAGPGFAKALRVTVGKASAETNWTQLTLPNATKIARGDALVATFWVRGRAADGKPGRVEMLFEKATDPWTKSVTRGVDAGPGWRRVDVPFESSEAYAPGEAMLSFRFAFGPQRVELGGVDLRNLGQGVALGTLVEGLAAKSPLGTVAVALDAAHPRQTMLGLGGNFTEPRYGRKESPDAVGRYVLAHLPVRHARVGLPLNFWAPSKGVYKEEGQAAASMRALAIFTERKVPTVLSIWEGPAWLLPGKAEATGRRLDPARYDDGIETVVRYLVAARDKYGARADYLSFNEPDYGVNFKFTPQELGDFVRKAGPRLKAAGLATRFVVGDTAGGSNGAAYAAPLLEDPTLKPYLGPVAFHCWDALGAPEASYQAIYNVAAKHGKPVWCLEAGHDSALWQARDPWATWSNAILTAMAYERTLRLARPSVMDYWTYENDYPVASAGGKPYPVFAVLRAMERVFAPGTRVAAPKGPTGELQALGTVGPKGRLALLLVNPRGAGRAALSGFAPGAAVRVEMSDAKAQGRASVLKADGKGRLSVGLPTRSVVTVVSGG